MTDGQASRRTRKRDAGAARRAARTNHEPPRQAQAKKHEPARPAARRRDDAPHDGRRWRAPALAIAIICALYLAGTLFFSRHFMPNTELNGIGVSLMRQDQAAQALQENVDAYQAVVSRDDFSLSFTGSDISLADDVAAEAADGARGMAGAAWPVQLVSGLFSPHALEVGRHVTYDADALGQLVGDAVDEYDQTATQPTDATLAYDQASGSFQAREGQAGTSLDRDAAVETVGQGVGELAEQIALPDSALTQPETSPEDQKLQDAVAQANASVVGDIDLTRDGSTAWTISKNQLAQWIALDAADEVTLDQSAAISWIDGTLADGQNHADGSTEYLVDSSRLARLIASDVAAHSDQAIEIPFWQRDEPPAASTDSSQGRRLDIDLAHQYARLYDASGSVIWESYIVSGDPTDGHATPTGHYSILDKTTDEELTGSDANGDGIPDYRTTVDYWMPFIGNTWALHDASWRSKFGGDIYEGRGSHGCINLPHDKAQDLYGKIEIGDEVIVHS